VHFLWAKGLSAKNIHKEMFPVYGGKCLLHKVCSKVADDGQPGRPGEIETEATVWRVEEVIRADRRITIDIVATAPGCSHGLAYSIMHDCLKFQKV
jgi:hypothetical protein